jgi:serine/threonine protein kinase
MQTEMADLFSGLEQFKLTQLQLTLTDRKLGCGSYATVYEVIYNGKKCAGKEIHKLLQEQGSTSYTLRRFEEECRILSRLHHPNIVQFHGVYFRESKGVPILIMEFLPMNLTSCIEKRGILPEEISYSILHGVALGLCYLHHQDPPIIHRDLSANNVLLTYDMEAKISDFGVSRMLNLTPLQINRMTETPGTPAYMPPEVMVANPVYDTTVDEFSFGILMIHIFSGKWPEPQCSPIRIEGGKMIPVSEAGRRDVFLQIIGYSHPLMELILKCVNNDPQQRVHVDVILKMLETVWQMSIGEKSKEREADSSNSSPSKGVVWQSNSEDHNIVDEEKIDYSTDNHRRIHQGSNTKQSLLPNNSSRTSPASSESECVKEVTAEDQIENEESGMVDFYRPMICEPTYSMGSPTSAGFSYIRDDFMALKVALAPKLHKLTDFITHAASSQKEKSIGEPCDDRETQTMAATTKSTISTNREEEQRRMHNMIEAVEEDDVVVVTMNPPRTKKHHESKMKTSDKQSLSGESKFAQCHSIA